MGETIGAVVRTAAEVGRAIRDGRGITDVFGEEGVEEGAEEAQVSGDLAEFLRQAQANAPTDPPGKPTELGGTIEDIFPGDEIAGALVELVEGFITDDIREFGQLDPDNVDDIVDATEGRAATILALGGSIGAAIEAAGLGQLEAPQELILQSLAGLGVNDVTGFELETRLQEGIQPALEARINRQHRAKFADIQDVIEQNLRNKDSDTGYTEDLATYGIRPEDVPVLEEVALQQIEFEELLETPAELGKIVPQDVLNAELDRAGYAEPTKDFLRDTANALERSARSYQELLVTEESVQSLDTLAENGVLEPAEAEELIPSEVEADPQAFRERFRILRDLPAGAPSGTDFEGAFASGYLSLEEFREELDQTDYDTEQYEEVLKKQVLDELDGDLQTALGIGLIEPGTYSDYAEFAEVPDPIIDALLRGQSLDDLATAELQQETDPGALPARSLSGIGGNRGAGLEAQGIETVRDVAEANRETIAEAIQVSPETAAEFIQQARVRVQ
jgi:hypothetical protein